VPNPTQINQSKPGGVSNGTLQPPCLPLAYDSENGMYAKVFSQIFDSSLAENYLNRLVFEDLLVLADKDGIVDMTPEAIARRTNVPLDIVKTALGELSLPDPKSRTRVEEGRRIVLLDDHRDWGWQIVNFKAYHGLRNEEGRREYMRRYQQQRRKQLSTPVNTRKHPLAHTDTYPDTYPYADKKDNTPPTKPAGVPIEDNSEQIINTWNAMAATCGLSRIEMGSSKRVKDLKARARTRLSDQWWREHWQAALAEIVKSPFLRGSNSRGWKANMDWFLRPDSAAKILEGAYRGGDSAGQSVAEVLAQAERDGKL